MSHEVNTSNNQDDWIECKICGYRSKEIATHVKNLHGINPKEYGLTKCKRSIDRVKGELNPGFNHGGKFSPWSKKSAFYLEESHQKAKDNSKDAIEKNSPVRRGYYSTEEEFRNAQKRDIGYFTAKYGEVEGTARHVAKTAKWIKSYKKQNFSNISQELFREVDLLHIGDTYFATKNRPEMSEYHNKEYRLAIGVLPDYIDINTNKIIEFDGDYWHGKVGNVERERKRDEKLKSAGYKVLHIKESEYKSDKQGTIDKCIKFLTQ